MDSPIPESVEERLGAETPEDVAVLYSWANLQGAKYRDFSASRREYRAQMRHRAAEQQRDEELRAKGDAEAAAAAAEKAAREAEEAARFHASEAKKASEQRRGDDSAIESEAQARALQHAAELNRQAAAERVEAARRAEAVAAAEASSRREAREVAEAQASAARQAARYAESEFLRRSLAGPQPSAIVPGQISDPYTDDQPAVLPGRLFHQPHVSEEDMQPTRLPRSRETRLLIPQPDPRMPASEHGIKEYVVTGPMDEEAKIAAQGSKAIEDAAATHKGHVSYYYEPDSHEKTAAVEHYAQAAPYAENRQREQLLRPQHEQPQHQQHQSTTYVPLRPSSGQRAAMNYEPAKQRPSGAYEAAKAAAQVHHAQFDQATGGPASMRRAPSSSRMVAAQSVQQMVRQQSGPYDAVKHLHPQAPRRTRGYQPDEMSGVHQAPYNPNPFGAEPVPQAPPPQAMYQPQSPPQQQPEGNLPAWINSSPSQPQSMPPQQRPSAQKMQQPSPVADTLQHSRERVAARWFALKGIFDHAAPEPPPEPVVERRQETRVPMLTLFSLAGGVGKTSLVATLGRALSSTGEKVLLTDTTSHGLLPFYFGASELRPGVVRTFSPPAGSSDAPIALVSYDVAQNNGDAASQEWLSDELTRNSRGIQRILLDLSPMSPWVIRRLVRMNSVVVVPVAPDMNSVISLGPVEKFFAGMMDGDGRPVQPYYLLNQFDASLPLHLDVREVMRQQLGDRLLPFVIRRSPSVSEALAEGMTVMDYAPDAPVASDYMNFASWLRMQSAPAASGFKNARWSER